MKKIKQTIKMLIFSVFCFTNHYSHAQYSSNLDSAFWDKVRFGGGIGLNIGNNFTNIAISPTLYYSLTEDLVVGAGINTSYIKSNDYKSLLYGVTTAVLYNPMESLQLSAEVDQLRANISYDTYFGKNENNFWNTALFLGAGYRLDNFTVGARYNVLNNNNQIYTNAWMPFVRVLF